MRSYLLTGAFWAGALERAARTIAQTLIAVLGVGAATAWEVDWWHAAGAALLAGALSLATSVAAAPIGPPGSPSLVHDRPAPVREVAL